MTTRDCSLWPVAVGAALALVLAGCGSKGTQNQTTTGDTVNLGASMSLSGALEKEGKPASIVFLSADDGFSTTVAAAGEAQAKTVGFTVLPGQRFPAGATDVSSALTKVKPGKPDVIVGSVHLAEGIAIVKQAAELGVMPAGGFAETVAPPTPDFATTLGAQANGVLSSSQWVPEVKGADAFIGSATDYRNGFQAKFGQAPEYHNAEATAACLAMVLAVRNAGSADPDQVRDALAGLDEQSFFGPLTFNDRGENVTKPMSVIQIQDGRLVTVWPKDQAAGPLVWPGTRG